MNNLAIGMDSYMDVNQAASDNGFDLTDERAAQDMLKAMEAGHIQGGDIGNPNQTNMGALKTESLDANLKIVEFTESDIRAWKMIAKAPAFNTVEEYNQLLSYGGFGGGFNNEGELPEAEDSIYRRLSQKTKYLGVTREVTHQAQLVKTMSGVGSMIQQEVQNGIKWILRRADQGLLFGDEKIVGQQWNGLYAQHMDNDQYTTLESYMTSPLVRDLRGSTLKETDIDQAQTTLQFQFAQGDTLIAPPQVISDFAEGYYSRQRAEFGRTGAVGTKVSEFVSQFGNIKFEYDIFAAAPAAQFPGDNLNRISPKAPATPTPVSATPVAADTLTKFNDGEGDYYYAVAGVNRYGKSAMVQIGGTVTVAATESVDLVFTATAGPYPPSAYVIFRSEVDPLTPFAQTKMSPIMTIPATGVDVKRGSLQGGVDGGAAGTVRDRNRWLPNTQQALLLRNNAQILCFKQLAPLMKMDLARLSPADRFMILLYGTPILFLPSKVIRFINIGRTA